MDTPGMLKQGDRVYVAIDAGATAFRRGTVKGARSEGGRNTVYVELSDGTMSGPLIDPSPAVQNGHDWAAKAREEVEAGQSIDGLTENGRELFFAAALQLQKAEHAYGKGDFDGGEASILEAGATLNEIHAIDDLPSDARLHLASGWSYVKYIVDAIERG